MVAVAAVEYKFATACAVLAGFPAGHTKLGSQTVVTVYTPSAGELLNTSYCNNGQMQSFFFLSLLS